MKFLKWALAILLALVLFLVVLERIAAERIEVVELHTSDLDSEPVTTRLWIVDHEGYQYLRVGSDGSGWYDRLSENGEFDVTRNGVRARYSAVLRQDKSALVNDLMQSKYTWGDTVIGALVGSRENSIPIELHPIP
ncbi:MAG: hypothetical protein AB8B95_02915 [Pseudohongiellaceae bacterium]